MVLITHAVVCDAQTNEVLLHVLMRRALKHADK